MTPFLLIPVEHLRVGMHVQLQVGWLNHPFPTSSFRIVSPEQLDKLRDLGVPQVRCIPSRSTPSAQAWLEQFAQAPQVPHAPHAEEQAQPAAAQMPLEQTSNGHAEEATGEALDALAAPESQPPRAWQDTEILPPYGETHDAEQGAQPSAEESLHAEVGDTPALPAHADSAAQRALQAQQRTLREANARFARATQDYLRVAALLPENPQQALQRSQVLVDGTVQRLMEGGDVLIRLLSEDSGARSAAHPVNVMVLALLLGKALGCTGEELRALGLAGLLHDMGKVMLPAQWVEPYAVLTPAEVKRYRSHVEESIELARRMGLPAAIIEAIGQHHERCDGQGFPRQLEATHLGRAGQVLGLVNHYERLCNPAHGTESLTPHEALALIFAQRKHWFEAGVLSAFIRMMGVYPPGSVVQLTDERYALVVMVNSSRPLRPRVVVHDAQSAPEALPVLDLEQVPALGIKRSLKPALLPPEVLQALSPRERVHYYFEHARPETPAEGAQ